MKQLVFLLLICTSGFAQKISKSDKKILASLKTNLEYLSSDALQGRRAGTPGEKMAADYIVQKFQTLGLEPAYQGSSYFQAFEISVTKNYQPNSSAIVGDSSLVAGKDFFPLAFSAEGSFSALASIPLQESGSFWFLNIAEPLQQNQNNPHFDLYDFILASAKEAKNKGAVGLLLFNNGKKNDELIFKKQDKTEPCDIPVVYLTSSCVQQHFADSFATYDVRLNISMTREQRMGNNVAAKLNNGAESWVVIGAHYDHLGYGEDHNSRYTGTDSAIHNGADDNASGTAAMLAIAEILKKSQNKKHNYLFVAFSGEELGLFGSKHFVEHAPIDLSNVNYMINMDMVGRLNDSSRMLTIGGYGTSPQWTELLADHGGYLQLKFDSSGTGPSDHTSFYRKDIPVLFFFTGLHTDYHKPSDDADLVNYSGEWQIVKLVCHLLQKTASMDRLAFSKTRENVSTSTASFKVTMGIMPDYTFSGPGVRADGISAGKAAEKAGLLTGDVIMSIGGYKVADMQSYMEALGKFKKGDPAEVEIKRNNSKDLLKLNVVF